METCQIIWTSRAVSDLRKIYNFNSDTIGEEKAFEIVQLIIRRIDLLSDKRFVEMGTSDESFEHLSRSYKKLVEGYYKITYRLSSNKKVVYINRVFDSRQNPSKNR